jgi:hypothetical protein
MRPIISTVGPIAASSATQIAASQIGYKNAPLVLNGVGGVNVANNVAASQTLGGAGAVALVSGIAGKTAGTPGVAQPTVTQTGYGVHCPHLYITSGGNDSGITFTVLGYRYDGSPFTDVVTGSNSTIVSTPNGFQSIISVTASGATASTITIGTWNTVILDAPRRVIVVSAGNDSGITFNIVGTDVNGNLISETLTGANGTATSNLSYYAIVKVVPSANTASTVTVGTNGLADTPLMRLDPWAGGTVSCQAVVSGTANYTIYISNDNPNDPFTPISAGNMTWDSSQTGAIGATTSQIFTFAQAPMFIKATLNSGTGSVRVTAVQHLSATY